MKQEPQYDPRADSYIEQNHIIYTNNGYDSRQIDAYGNPNAPNGNGPYDPRDAAWYGVPGQGYPDRRMSDVQLNLNDPQTGERHVSHARVAESTNSYDDNNSSVGPPPASAPPLPGAVEPGAPGQPLQPQPHHRKHRHHHRKKEYTQHRPWFMGLISLVQCIIMGLEILFNGGLESFQANPLFGPNTDTLVRMGAKDVKLIRAGEAYRWFAPMILHGGLLHVAFILISQLGFGFTIESKIGSFRTAAIYILSGVGGTVASALMDPRSISVGASGAVFGLVGSVFPFIALNWSVLQTPWKALLGLLMVVAVNLAIGLTVAIVDNWSHLGGFITGLFVGMW
eukprot:CAMPEP_0184659832 /NCGR_PEP_ID=MMETSP0308-20130426/31242_1 /TAXON_ID=38269 /ORGANISM="Gloeochaete witrockiana, Strain SAG 46.84" /LENGTH=338 /DNA_ID=CAMNT_0027099947 /DNA_START=16 /DNA_END=1029 /DNA_ORIENTATION=+